MTTDQVAEELNLSKTVVWRQIQRGTLPAEKFGRDWRIRREDFERFRQLDRRRGRPRLLRCADPPADYSISPPDPRPS